jgi:hypothetical protein
LIVARGTFIAHGAPLSCFGNVQMSSFVGHGQKPKGKLMFRTALASAFAMTIGLAVASGQETPKQNIQVAQVTPSKEFLCGAEASRRRFVPGSAERRNFIANCMKPARQKREK